MSTLRVAAPAKVNWSLRILSRREDGYHEIDSLFVPIGLFDHVVVRCIGPGEDVRLVVSDSAVPSSEDNLAWRAADAWGRRFGPLGSLVIEIQKRIPVGAGLGGGSSDAAAVLRALARLADLPERSADLLDVARHLGADVPFFLWCRPARVRGIGDRIEPVLDFRPRSIVVAFPGFPVETRWAYEAYDDRLTSIRSADTISRFDSGGSGLAGLGNDFEEVVGERFPRIRELKRQFMAWGAEAAGLSGSGSAVFGVFGDRDEAERAAVRFRQSGTWASATETLNEPSECEWWETGGR